MYTPDLLTYGKVVSVETNECQNKIIIYFENGECVILEYDECTWSSKFMSYNSEQDVCLYLQSTLVGKTIRQFIHDIYDNKESDKEEEEEAKQFSIVKIILSDDEIIKLKCFDNYNEYVLTIITEREQVYL